MEATPRTFPRLAFTALYVFLGLLVFSYWHVERATTLYVSDDLDFLPSTKGALLPIETPDEDEPLWRASYLRQADAAARLFESGKAREFYLAGEPLAVAAAKRALVDRGIDAWRVTDLGDAGEIDALLACRAELKRREFLVVAEDERVRRAVYAARKRRYAAYGYETKTLPAPWEERLPTTIAQSFSRFSDLASGVASGLATDDVAPLVRASFGD
jgi:vancomycin permeability regulator SanA